MEAYLHRFEAWKKMFEAESSITMSDDPGCSWSKEQRTLSKSFEVDLIALCQEYGFDPENPSYVGDNQEDGLQLDAGNIGSYAGELLIEALTANRRYREDLPVEVARKRGPGRTWSPRQAEAILVGLKLFEDSRAGLKLVREFLGSHDNRSDILVWKDQQILYLQRITLSWGKKRIIVNFSKCRSEQAQLIRRVRKKANILDSRSEGGLRAG